MATKYAGGGTALAAAKSEQTAVASTISTILTRLDSLTDCRQCHALKMRGAQVKTAPAGAHARFRLDSAHFCT